MTLSILSSLALLAHWLIVVGPSIRVIMKRPSVGVSLAWLIVILSVPFVGAGLYFLFDERRLGRRPGLLHARVVVRRRRSPAFSFDSDYDASRDGSKSLIIEPMSNSDFGLITIMTDWAATVDRTREKQ